VGGFRTLHALLMSPLCRFGEVSRRHGLIFDIADVARRVVELYEQLAEDKVLNSTLQIQANEHATRVRLTASW